MSAVASDAVLYSSSAHRAGSSAHRGKDTSERAESGPFSEHLENARDIRGQGGQSGHESRSEVSANRPSSKRDPSSERAATSSSGKPEPAASASEDSATTAGSAADPESAPSAAKVAASEAAATAETAPANGEDADKDTVNAITPTDVLDATLIDPATGEPVAADPAALASAAAQALDTANAGTTETGKSKDGKDEKKTDDKADTGTDKAAVADKTVSSPDIAPVIVAAGGDTPPTGNAPPAKVEAGQSLTIDLHPAVITQAMPLKTNLDKADAGKDAANTLTAEDKTGLPAAKAADADQPDNGAQNGAKTAAAAPNHRQTTTEQNDISAVKPAVDADISARSAQNGGASPTPPVNTGLPAQHSTPALQTAASGPAPAPASSQPVPLVGLGIALAAKAMEGKNRFEIRLDPPELGKIEVKLEVHHNGEVTSRMIADRPDTLDLLRRDAAGLERALQDAGLKTSGQGLQFSLRDQGFAGHDQAPERSDTAHIVVNDEIQSVSELPQRHYRSLAGLRGGLDIRV